MAFSPVAVVLFFLPRFYLYRGSISHGIGGGGQFATLNHLGISDTLQILNPSNFSKKKRVEHERFTSNITNPIYNESTFISRFSVEKAREHSIKSFLHNEWISWFPAIHYVEG